jgi:hypothetical protein
MQTRPGGCDDRCEGQQREPGFYWVQLLNLRLPGRPGGRVHVAEYVSLGDGAFAWQFIGQDSYDVSLTSECVRVVSGRLAPMDGTNEGGGPCKVGR